MKSQRRTGVKRDLAQGVVLIEYVDDAKLVKIKSRMRLKQALQDFRTNVDIFRLDEAADTAAIVALLNLVPPAIDLVAHHGGLFDEEYGVGQQVKQMMLRPGHGGEKLPTGKHAYSAGGSGLDLHFLLVGIVLFGS